jgi:hypothetical protein
MRGHGHASAAALEASTYSTVLVRAGNKVLESGKRIA